MSILNRTALLTKIHKAIKKHYKLPAVKGDQPVLDALLFASCLENAKFEAAEAGYNTIKSSFFDWNEIRVTTVKELAETLHALPDPAAAATHFKNILQTVFESEYSFDLEALKKQNLGQAVKRLEKLEGATPFAVAYATQMALGGHSIPLDQGALSLLIVLGVISQNEARAHSVPGLERAIPKSKGQEFGLLLHQFGADFLASPFSPTLRDMILSIAPDARERFPKRATKKPEPAPVPVESKADTKKKQLEPAPQKLDGKKGAPQRHAV